VAKMKWGTKRTCLSCGKRFYDMRRDPIVCPGCNAPFEVNTSRRSRRQRSTQVAEFVASPLDTSTKAKEGMEAEGDGKKFAAAEDGGTENSLAVEEEASETIEDPLELDEDNDDMAEVIEGIDESNKTDV